MAYGALSTGGLIEDKKGIGNLGIRVYLISWSPVLCRLPYLFGMVINSEPSHKCHSQEVVSQEYSDNGGIEQHG